MALYKEIRQADGVITNYHRIMTLSQTVNQQNSIIVLSYVDDVSRSGEKGNVESHPYQKCITYELTYDPGMTVESAYTYLKTLPPFYGAEDA